MSDAKLELVTAGYGAVALYAMADRDICDFIDALGKQTDIVLAFLYAMLATENQPGENDPRRVKTDVELNGILEPIVRARLEQRGIFGTWETLIRS